jgi:hypothetical protein
MKSRAVFNGSTTRGQRITAHFSELRAGPGAASSRTPEARRNHPAPRRHAESDTERSDIDYRPRSGDLCPLRNDGRMEKCRHDGGAILR